MSFFTVLFLIVGVGALSIGAYLYWRAKASQNWPWVMGEVLSARVRETVDTTGSGRTISRHFPEVTYEYRVGGRTYRGKRIRFGGPLHTDRETAEAWLQSYPVGGQVRVYYNPKRPQEAVLQPSSSPTAWILIFVGLFSLFVGLALLMDFG